MFYSTVGFFLQYFVINRLFIASRHRKREYNKKHRKKEKRNNPRKNKGTWNGKRETFPEKEANTGWKAHC